MSLEFQYAVYELWGIHMQKQADGVCVVYDVIGESGSQVVPQAPMPSYAQFLRVCLYMMTPDLSPWHMSEIAPLHLWCISQAPDLRHTHTNTLRDWEEQGKTTWLLLVTHTNTHKGKMMNCTCPSVFIYPRAAKDYRRHQHGRVCARHAFEYTHKVVSQAGF